ncbi:fimbria/pilus outer membrane usher protein [Brevundimonas sp. 2R-24]|uniref:Fimbria/pilus outer membrane usher protein n=1 Tax=Peiella sedimenti TaxID=3061083 RepID=A0ABT8SNI2_9CAUL|nr:fimbria/pilus outer membrane usher protein [Caulobacteraceae bacterium XZ-24]
MAVVLLSIATPSVADRTHLIKPGDTLSGIARAYEVSLDRLAEANGIVRRDFIMAGARLVIPDGDQAGPAVAAADQAGDASALEGPAAPVAAAETAASQPARGANPLPDNSAVIDTSLPVVVDGRRYPAVAVRTTVSQLIEISPAALSEILTTTIDERTHIALRELGPGLRPVEDLAGTGVTARLDPTTLSVVVTVPPTARPPLGVSLLPPGNYEGVERIYPGRVSAGVTGAVLVTDNLEDDRDPFGQFAFAGFANFGGLTGVNVDFGGSFNFGADDSEFRRDAIVVFKDDPQRSLRYSAGDLTPYLPRLGGPAGLLGLSFERNYEELDPTRNIRPTGRRSFFLDRPATVEVYANGVLLSRFQSEGGPIDIGDIPLADVSNNISIVVEDAFGRRELEAFSLSSDLTLLAPGLSEFSFALGALRDESGSGYEYGSDLALTGFYTRGLSESLTYGVHGALSEALINAGGAVAFAVEPGVVSFESGFSTSDFAGQGYAMSLNFRGGGFLGVERNDNLTASLDYTSEDFATLADPNSLLSQEWIAAADYRFDLTPRTSMSVGGYYATQHGRDGADRFANLGLSRQFGRVLATGVLRVGEYADGREESGVFFSLSVPFGLRQTGRASYDSITQTGRVEYVRARGFEVPDYNYRVGAITQDGATEVNAEVGYTSTRFEGDLGVVSQLETNAVGSQGQVVRGRFQSGIAFVDGAFGIARDPGRGFYLFRAHPSLDGAEVSIQSGAGSTTLARSGPLGPAIAPARNPYRPEELRVGVSGGPAGYDIGSGRYLVVPGARTGIGVTIGSDAYRSVVATLMYDGGPVALMYGRIIDAEGVEQVVFTNRVGRAAFSNLAPGRYRVVFPGMNAGFTFTVGENDDAYRDAGVIELERLP